MRSSHALKMLLQTFCRRVLTARRSEMLLMIALDVLVPPILQRKLLGGHV